MRRVQVRFVIVLAAFAVALPTTLTEATQPVELGRAVENIPDHWNWAQVSSWLKRSNAVVELADASIIIEVNSTDGDAGFQIFLDGEGWRTVRVYGPDGRRILKVDVAGGVKNIGGGTELFMETAEPEYENLEELEELIELLPEGDYYFLAKNTDGNWATGTAELTHDVPAGPGNVYPELADDECPSGLSVNSLVIEWDPVTHDIWGEDEVEIEGYQVIVEAEEDPERRFDVIVPSDVTMVSVPPEVLGEGGEFAFEVLAIEESGNQTITEGCFQAE